MFVYVPAGRTPHTSPYLSVQLFNQGDVSKIGVNGKDTSSTGVKADMVGDRVSLWVCPIQSVHMRAWKETQMGDLESGTQLFLKGAVALNQGFNCSYSDCNSVPQVQPRTEHLLLSSPLLAASHSLSLFLTAVSEMFVWATLQLVTYDTDCRGASVLLRLTLGLSLVMTPVPGARSRGFLGRGAGERDAPLRPEECPSGQYCPSCTVLPVVPNGFLSRWPLLHHFAQAFQPRQGEGEVQISIFFHLLPVSLCIIENWVFLGDFKA